MRRSCCSEGLAKNGFTASVRNWHELARSGGAKHAERTLLSGANSSGRQAKRIGH